MIAVENMKTHISDRGYDFFIVSVLFIISTILRMYNYADQPIAPDEIAYSSYAYSIITHNFAWPPEHMGCHPPLFHYILATCTYFFEGGLDVFRVVPIFFGSLTVCVIYFLGKSLYNRRVGILAAILLCFCSLHILYSRIIMLEALWMFLAYTSLYFFWKSYNKKDDIKYAILSGVFLGLACDTKYNALLLYISFILFILWIKRRGWFLGWKELLKRKYFVLFFVSILVFSPVLIDLYVHNANPFFWQFFARQITKEASYSAVGCSGILDILKYGFNSYTDMMIDGHSVATSSLSWLPLFRLSASFLLIVTLPYYLYLLLRKEPSGSFIIIFYMLSNIAILLFLKRYDYYLLWAYPAFFIMTSNICVSFFDQIKFRYAKRGLRFFTDATKILVLISICIFSFSYIVVGTMAPSLNEGEQAGYEKQVLNIKDKIQPGECIATDLFGIVIHYTNKYDIKAKEHNIFLLPLYKPVKRLYYTSTEVNVELLDRVKPRFIITSEYYFSFCTTVRANKEIRQHYNLISNEDAVLLYERKKNN